jgi:hypothetical protein
VFDGWSGFTLEYVSDETTFEYVRISGAEKDDGGGMSLSFSNPTLTHVTITGNTAENYGGGMRLSSSNPILTHVTITGNTAGEGGGMRLYNSNPTLTYVTISDNDATYGGGMYVYYSNPTLTNSILWNNSPESILLDSDEEPIITYSDIEGGWEGEGNIDIDPLFTDSENDDYTLMENSPCIDTGIEIIFRIGKKWVYINIPFTFPSTFYITVGYNRFFI